jgi:hypothetical protein
MARECLNVSERENQDDVKLVHHAPSPFGEHKKERAAAGKNKRRS